MIKTIEMESTELVRDKDDFKVWNLGLLGGHIHLGLLGRHIDIGLLGGHIDLGLVGEHIDL